MSKALVLIDIQNDYFPDGKMELKGIEKAAINAAEILERFRINKESVFHIQHISIASESPFFIPDTYGANINDRVKPLPNEKVIQKFFPNSFRDTILYSELKQHNIEEIAICGAMSHMCIDTSVRAAFDLGFNCTLIEDACATCDLLFNGKIIKTEDVNAAFMCALSFPFAKVITTKAYLEKPV